MSIPGQTCLRACSRLQTRFAAPNQRWLPHRSRIQRSAIHTVPELKHGSQLATEGVPELLSPKGYQIAWLDYQKLMVDRLNSLTEGYPEANETTKSLTLTHARNPQHAALFNHASMAWNNHFFFDALAPTASGRGLSEHSQLYQSLMLTFGSMQDLKQTMIEMAYTMFGPGYIWLVWAQQLGDSPTSDGWRLLPTYLAGTPFTEAGYRQQAVDQNTAAGSFGAYSASAQKDAARAPGTGRVEPVLCVNAWQHVYLHDYGVGGKREYLERWWDAIDWQEVQSRAPQDAKRGRPQRTLYNLKSY